MFFMFLHYRYALFEESERREKERFIWRKKGKMSA